MGFAQRLLNFLIVTSLVCLSVIMIGTNQVKAQAQLCTITIEKEASPADDTGFLFTVEGTGNNFEETLRDPSDKEFQVFILLGNVEATVVEQVPEGWVLEETLCERGGTDNCGEENNEPCVDLIEVPNGRTFVCLGDGGTASCTFFNTRVAPFPTAVPALSKWGLLAMAGIIGIIGFIVIRRRKALA